MQERAPDAFASVGAAPAAIAVAFAASGKLPEPLWMAVCHWQRFCGSALAHDRSVQPCWACCPVTSTRTALATIAVAFVGASLLAMAGCLVSLGRGGRRSYSGSPLRGLIKRVDLHKSPRPLWEGRRDQGRFPQKHSWSLWESLWECACARQPGVAVGCTVACRHCSIGGQQTAGVGRRLFCFPARVRPRLSRCVRQSSGAGRPGPSQSLRCRCAVFPRPSHRRRSRRRTIRQ